MPRNQKFHKNPICCEITTFSKILLNIESHLLCSYQGVLKNLMHMSKKALKLHIQFKFCLIGF